MVKEDCCEIFRTGVEREQENKNRMEKPNDNCSSVICFRIKASQAGDNVFAIIIYHPPLERMPEEKHIFFFTTPGKYVYFSSISYIALERGVPMTSKLFVLLLIILAAICCCGREDFNGTSGGTTGTSGTSGTTGTSGSSGITATNNSGVVVSISNRVILVNGEPFLIKGVCWNPVPKGSTSPDGLDYAGYADQDIALMKAAGFNVVRTYETITDTTVLDKLYANGIYILNSVYTYYGSTVASAVSKVSTLKDHPAILMWVIGNEWNYNNFYYYDSTTFANCITRLQDVSKAVRAVDSSRPIASVYGGTPSAYLVSIATNVDIWGINQYTFNSFNDTFSDWTSISTKPMFIAEYGADAWNTDTGAEDQLSQANATLDLTKEILANSTVSNSANVCSGGTIFEWADEWWKDSDGTVTVHDSGGHAPGSGPYPDNVFNEEYWGIVDIDRTPRIAYNILKNLYTP